MAVPQALKPTLPYNGQPEETVSRPLSPLRGSGLFPLYPALTRRANFMAAAARLVYWVFLAPCYTTNFLFQSRQSLKAVPREGPDLIRASLVHPLNFRPGKIQATKADIPLGPTAFNGSNAVARHSGQANVFRGPYRVPTNSEKQAAHRLNGLLKT